MQQETKKGNDSFDLYRRHPDGPKFVKKVQGKTILIGNEWVVSYSPKLLLHTEAHVNVEICSTVKSVKYLYKYCFKGHDMCRIVMKDQEGKINYDEIKSYEDMRYVTPHEAHWRMYESVLDKKSHAVERLELHLPNEQNEYWKDKANLKAVIEKAELRNTKLTAFFELNKRAKVQKLLLEEINLKLKSKNKPILTLEKVLKDEKPSLKFDAIGKDEKWADEYYYHEIAEYLHAHYTKKCVVIVDEIADFVPIENNPGKFKEESFNGYWKTRGGWQKVIGRMFNMTPMQGDLFYLRLLLLHIKGVTDFDDLLEGHETFYDRCEATIIKCLSLLKEEFNHY